MTLGAAAALLLALPAAAVPPTAPRGRVIEYENSVRAFWKAGAWEPMGDLTARWEGEEQAQRYRALTVGSYRRVLRHLKVGAFYRLQQGARHDDDWRRREPGSPIWEWEDTRRRSEHLLVLDATPRVQLSFLPGKNWVFFFRNQYHYNSFNGQSSLKVSPELAYFWARKDKPLGTVFLMYESTVALNYGVTKVVERWLYLGGLWHAVPGVLSVGPHAALREWTWGTSVHSPPQDRYRVLQRSLVLGGVLVAKLGRKR